MVVICIFLWCSVADHGIFNDSPYHRDVALSNDRRRVPFPGRLRCFHRHPRYVSISASVSPNDKRFDDPSKPPDYSSPHDDPSPHRSTPPRSLNRASKGNDIQRMCECMVFEHNFLFHLFPDEYCVSFTHLGLLFSIEIAKIIGVSSATGQYELSSVFLRLSLSQKKEKRKQNFAVYQSRKDKC